MVEVQLRCAFIIAGLVAVSYFCIRNWVEWEEFRREEEAHHHNGFMGLFFSILATLVLLNWRLVLSLLKVALAVARGTGPLSLATTAYLVTLMVWWTLFSNDWDNKKNKSEYPDATWQFSYIGSIVTPLVTALLIFGIVKTGGKIC